MTDPKLAEVEQVLKIVIGDVSPSDKVILSIFMYALGPVIHRLLDAKDAEIAALKRPMACGHPGACEKEITTYPEPGVPSTHYECTACEHERLARTAALRQAAAICEKGEHCRYADHAQEFCACREHAKAILALISAADQSALDAHDKEVARKAIRDYETAHVGSMKMKGSK